VPRPDKPLDADSALKALDAAAAQVGLDATDADLVRIGSNAIFRLRTAPIIGRVAPSLKRLESASRELEISWWLESEEIPAVRGLHLTQPITTADRVVTFWHSVSDKTEYGTTTELAQLLRQLHTRIPPIALPGHDPIAKAHERISEISSLDQDDLTFLLGRLDELATGYRELKFELPRGVIHGDANVGNILRDRTGKALLADLDSVATGPREWDLILTALYYDRFGWHTDAEYAAFAETYEFDVMAWSGYEVMRDLRELLMVAWLAQSITSDRGRSEVTKRVHTLRTNGSRRDWQAF
jgi:aminoglycoside phosphotransferase (APT) family kinase protein